MIRTLAAAAALLTLTACGPVVSRDMAGESFTVRGASYEQVWQAAQNAVVAEFPKADIQDADAKQRGEILAGSNGCAYGSGDYLGVYISPTTAQSERYTIKIVSDDMSSTNRAARIAAVRKGIKASVNTIAGVRVK